MLGIIPMSSSASIMNEIIEAQNNQSSNYIGQSQNLISMINHDPSAFVVGSQGPLITVFLDPNCVYCNLLIKQALPLIDTGQLRMRVIMVAGLGRSSYYKAANIIPYSMNQLIDYNNFFNRHITERQNINASWKHLLINEQRFNYQNERGGISSICTRFDSHRLINEIQYNNQILFSTHVTTTPYIVYQRGNVMYTVNGLPNEGMKNWVYKHLN